MPQQYSNTIKQHYKNPLNAGKLLHFTHTAKQVNPLCGDEIRVYLILKDNQIRDIKYETRGCMISIAAASVLSEFIKGKTLPQIKKITKGDIDKLLGVKISPAREPCAMLMLNAIKSIK